MKRLIVNADDFGLTKAVSAGILDAMERGIVTSTSAVVCIAGSVAHLKHSAPALAGRVGIHLQLTDGVPCSNPRFIHSLLTASGRFPRFDGELGDVNPDEVVQEWRAQVERFLHSGIEPTHIDTHHHVHRRPGIFQAYCEIAQFYRLPARSVGLEMTGALRLRGISCADYCETEWIGAAATSATFIAAVTEAFEMRGYTVIEVMCHPGYVDASLKRKSVYVADRARELQVLCSPELARRLRELGVALVGGPDTAPRSSYNR